MFSKAQTIFLDTVTLYPRPKNCYENVTLFSKAQFFFFLWLLGLIALPGHIATLFPVRALYPEPRIWLYEIGIYHHCSFALSIELPVGTGLQDPQQLLVRLA